jgi:ferredoxin-like protein FixX
VSGGERERRTFRRPQQYVVPDHLPGESEYGIFMNHLTGCADCGYGRIHCEKATEMWQAYKKARRKSRT